MKRRILYTTIITMMMLALSIGNLNAAETAAMKVGYVDLNRALNEVEAGKKAKAQLEAEGNALRKKIELKQNEIQKEKENLDKQRPILSADAVREKELKLQQSFMELQKMGAESEKSFGEKEATFIKPISEKLKNIILKLGNDGGYAVILPKEMILFAPASEDLTDKVISLFNSQK